MPTVSKHPNDLSLPVYMRKRTAISAPTLGFPVVMTYGPMASMTAANSGSHSILLPGNMRLRLMALGWYCSSASGTTANMWFGRQATRAALITTPGALNTGINLLTAPSGVIYFADSASSVYIPSVTAGANDATTSTDPDVPAPGVGSPRRFFDIRFTISAATVENLCVYLMCWATDYLQVNKGND